MLAKKTKYRNIPEWQLAIEFQNRFPDIPLINDPSHITGNLSYIIISLKDQVFSDIKSWQLTSNLTFKEEKIVLNKI